MGNNSINLDQLMQPLHANGSITKAVIERFNAVCGGNWSFRIIEHQVRDSEVIVLGELSAGSSIRQQFGKTIITFDTDPTTVQGLYEHLAKAADDALVQCAYMFGIKHDTEKQQQKIPTTQSPPNTSSNNNGNGDRKLTNRQLAAIFGLGKANGLGQKEVIDLTTNRFDREPLELTVSEASELISEFSQKIEKE